MFTTTESSIRPMSNAVSLSMTVCNLLVLPIFLPINIMVLWILKTKSEFKRKTAYSIIFTIAVMDCIHMVTTFTAGIMNLAPVSLSASIGAYGSCLRNGYLLAIPFLEFFLAVNRLFVILRFHCSNKATVGFRVVIVIFAICPIPFLYGLSVVDANIAFSYHEATYRFKGPKYFEDPYSFLRMALHGSALTLYVITVGVIICQKRRYSNANFAVSIREVRLLVQALFQSLPVAFTVFIGTYLFQEIWKHGLLFVVWSIVSITVPASHLLILIVFNPHVRRHLEIILYRKASKKLFVTPVIRSNGSTRSENVQRLKRAFEISVSFR